MRRNSTGWVELWVWPHSLSSVTFYSKIKLKEEKVVFYFPLKFMSYLRMYFFHKVIKESFTSFDFMFIQAFIVVRYVGLIKQIRNITSVSWYFCSSSSMLSEPPYFDSIDCMIQATYMNCLWQMLSYSSNGCIFFIYCDMILSSSCLAWEQIMPPSFMN